MAKCSLCDGVRKPASEQCKHNHDQKLVLSPLWPKCDCLPRRARSDVANRQISIAGHGRSGPARHTRTERCAPGWRSRHESGRVCRRMTAPAPALQPQGERGALRQLAVWLRPRVRRLACGGAAPSATGSNRTVVATHGRALPRSSSTPASFGLSRAPGPAMFIKRDTRKVPEILVDEDDPRKELKLGRRSVNCKCCQAASLIPPPHDDAALPAQAEKQPISHSVKTECIPVPDEGFHGLRREAEFEGSTAMLLKPSNAAQLANLEYLSLYHNKLTRLDHFDTVSRYCFCGVQAGNVQSPLCSWFKRPAARAPAASPSRGTAEAPTWMPDSTPS